MFRNSIFFLWIFFAFIPSVSAQSLSSDNTQEILYQFFEEFRNSYDRVQDYSAILNKEEFSDGKWQTEQLEIRFKKPFKVRIKALDGIRKNWEIVFVEGGNNNKILLRLGGLLRIVPTVSVDPDSSIAKGPTGDTIRDAGIGRMMDKILEVTELARKNNDLSLTLLERKENPKSFGRKILKIDRVVPPGKGYASNRLVIYVDEELGIPIGADRYNEKKELIGKYFYENLKVNEGLKDSEFKL